MQQSKNGLLKRLMAVPEFPENPLIGEVDEDNDLVQVALADPGAFDMLYRRYSLAVYRYLRVRFKEDVATDLTQQVFLKALEALPKYRANKAPFAGWLFVIVRNTAITAYRRKRTLVDLDLLPEVLQPVASDNLEEQTEQQETLEHLRQLLAKLKPKQRDLLALRFAGGLSYREIGVSLGKNEKAIQKQLNRILGQLKLGFMEGYDEA